MGRRLPLLDLHKPKTMSIQEFYRLELLA